MLELELVEFVALFSTIGGSLVNVFDGILNRPDGEGVSKKKILSAIITAVTSSMLLINFGMIPEQTSGMSILGIIVAYGILGYGGDKGLSRLDSNKISEQLRVTVRNGKKYFTGIVFDDQYARTYLITYLIQKINNSDSTLTPKQQNDLIEKLPGLTRKQMEELMPKSISEIIDSVNRQKDSV